MTNKKWYQIDASWESNKEGIAVIIVRLLVLGLVLFVGDWIISSFK